jgi:hypothetical protein
MDRKEFLCRTLQLGLGSVWSRRPRRSLGRGGTAEAELPRELQVNLMEGCGRGCFRRHEFTRAIAEAGRGDVEKLIAAYRKNFEVWRDGPTVHVRYGEVSSSKRRAGARAKAAAARPRTPRKAKVPTSERSSIAPTAG